jgi:prevent-host-death family protein
MATNYGYIEVAMLISVADAKNQLSQLIRAVEDGEEVIITRSGKPVVQLTPAPTGARKVRWGALKGQIELKPGWDEPITEEQFLKGEF